MSGITINKNIFCLLLVLNAAVYLVYCRIVYFSYLIIIMANVLISAVVFYGSTYKLLFIFPFIAQSSLVHDISRPITT